MCHIFLSVHKYVIKNEWNKCSLIKWCWVSASEWLSWWCGSLSGSWSKYSHPKRSHWSSIVSTDFQVHQLHLLRRHSMYGSGWRCLPGQNCCTQGSFLGHVYIFSLTLEVESPLKLDCHPLGSLRWPLFQSLPQKRGLMKGLLRHTLRPSLSQVLIDEGRVGWSWLTVHDSLTNRWHLVFWQMWNPATKVDFDFNKLGHRYLENQRFIDSGAITSNKATSIPLNERRFVNSSRPCIQN